jgi:hypothetical protein
MVYLIRQPCRTYFIYVNIGKMHLTHYGKIGYNLYDDRGFNFFITIMFYCNSVGIFMAAN